MPSKKRRHLHYCINSKCGKTWQHAVVGYRKDCPLKIFAYCAECVFKSKQIPLFGGDNAKNLNSLV